MKRISYQSILSLLVFCIFFIFKISAQPTLIGMTSSGGMGAGNIFSMFTGSTSVSSNYSLSIENQGARLFYTRLTEASNGKIYGLTAGGGGSASGVLFEYDTTSNQYTKKVDFDGSVKGASPLGSLIQASNGKLYGLSGHGGAFGYGVIFEYDAGTNTFIKKLDFDSTSMGSHPYGSFLQANNGKLYALTYDGGQYGRGTLFEYTIGSNTFSKKLDFNNIITGSNPPGDLIQAPNGKLYGLCQYGGANGFGVIFEYDINTNSYAKKWDFDGTTGRNPYGSPVLGANSKIYGLAAYGGLNGSGVLFEFDLNSFSYLDKFDFNSPVSGGNPISSLAKASNGLLYGFTYFGGVNSIGTFFKFDPSLSVFTKILDLNDAIGANCRSTPMQASNGKLYGVTTNGGIYGSGVLYQYNISNNNLIKKVDLNISAEGQSPFGSLFKATNDNLYGLTYAGGVSNMGVLFEFNPLSNTYAKKIDFTGLLNGQNPQGTLIQASNTKLYGMTSAGGDYSVGVLFEYDITSNTLTKKLDFKDTLGSYACGSLIQASNGKLYGMTYYGGLNAMGVLFEYDIITNTYVKKVDFNGALNGSSPANSLIQATNNKLYGMTQYGGTNNLGVLFEFDPATSIFSKKLDFNGSNGSTTSSSLLKAANGKLYGLTQSGGINNDGVLFEYDFVSNVYAKKFDFSSLASGRNPSATLYEASNGKMYGLTPYGGVNNKGVIFEYDPISNSVIKKLDFNGSNGGVPQQSNLIELPTCIGCIEIKENKLIYADYQLCPNPAMDIISVSGLTDEIQDIEIYNSEGKLVLEKEFLANNNQFLRNAEINISSLCIGLYIVAVNFKNSSITNNKLKLIKQ